MTSKKSAMKGKISFKTHGWNSKFSIIMIGIRWKEHPALKKSLANQDLVQNYLVGSRYLPHQRPMKRQCYALIVKKTNTMQHGKLNLF